MNKWVKKLLVSSTASLAALTLVACSSGESETASNESGSAQKEEITVGILQFMEHDSLKASADGFIEGLEEAGYVQGENLTIELLNAQGDQANLQSMSEQLADNDLILGIATPAAQSLANAGIDAPVLFTAVTDPLDAGLVQSLEAPGANVTGTSDQMPIASQIKLLMSLAPEAKKIGIIYNSSEPNSKIQSDQAIALIEEAGLEAQVATVTTTNDVQQVLTSLAGDVDGLYIPTDNTLASTAATVGQIAKEYKLPVVTGSAEQVEAGGLATYSIDFFSLGKQTSQMALDILEGADPATIPVQTPKNYSLTVNEDMAAALGIDPASIKSPE